MVMQFKRKQYMARECSFREYYAQFVTQATIDKVVRVIGRNRLLQSTDEHMNDISLHIWESMRATGMQGSKLKEAGDYSTLSSDVCIHKEAALQYIAQHKAGGREDDK